MSLLREEVFSQAWPCRPLGEVVEFLDNLRKPVKSSDRIEGDYNYYGANGLQGTINDFLFDEPLVLLAEDGGHFGNPERDIAYIAEGKYWVNNHAHVLKPREGLDLRFLYRVLQKYDVSKYIKGATRAKLTKGDAALMPIPLPPLEEQKRIAAILDKADGIRRKRQQAIELADEFLRSVFLDMFGDPVTNPKGWEVKPLGKSCKLQGGYAFKSKDYTDIGTPIVKITNVHFEDLEWNDVDYVPESFVTSKSSFLLSVGDLVMAMTRPVIKSLGAVKVVEIKPSDIPCLLNQRVGRFIGYEDTYHSDFLKYFLYSSYFKNEVEKLCSVALQPNVSAKQIESIPAYLPSMELQMKFSNVVSEVKKVSVGMVKAEKVTFFEALSQKAFKGEL